MKFKLYARKIQKESKNKQKTRYARNDGISLRMHDLRAADPVRHTNQTLGQEGKALHEKCLKGGSRFFFTQIRFLKI